MKKPMQVGAVKPRPVEILPRKVVEIELSQALPALISEDDLDTQTFLALVRLHNQPIALLNLTGDAHSLTPQSLAAQLWDALSEEINHHLESDELALIDQLDGSGLHVTGEPACQRVRHEFLANAPFASVVLATHNRPESLARCLKGLLALDYPHYEIIVVDNAPDSNSTLDMIQRDFAGVSHLRYVREDRPGLAAAHNCGLSLVKGEYVAFTDDDVRVDQNWLAEMILGFSAGARVGCVTGMIAPAELETQSQIWFEEYGGYNKGFQQQIFDRYQHRPDDPLFPFTAGRFGSGANMAFRTQLLLAQGGFDPAIGTGTPAMGGDDLAAFFQVIQRGYQLVYQPSALLYHWHHREYPRLCRQTFGYGVGLGAFLTKTLVDNPRLGWTLTTRLPAGVAYLLSPNSPKNHKKSANYPAELTRLERKGLLYGPAAYLRSRWQAHWRYDRPRQNNNSTSFPTSPAQTSQ